MVFGNLWVYFEQDTHKTLIVVVLSFQKPVFINFWRDLFAQQQ